MRLVCRRCGRVHDAGACPGRRGAALAARRDPEGARAFRSSARWQRCAAEARRLDGGTCVTCMELRAAVTTDGLEGHHVVPLSECLGTPLEDDPANVATLCRTCHAEAECGGIGRAELLDLVARHRVRFE